jgi:hypothetical protein
MWQNKHHLPLEQQQPTEVQHLSWQKALVAGWE